MQRVDNRGDFTAAVVEFQPVPRSLDTSAVELMLLNLEKFEDLVQQAKDGVSFKSIRLILISN